MTLATPLRATRITRTMLPNSRRDLPLGTIRVRRDSETGRETRVVKVSMDAQPSSKRWMAVARWWWLKNKGPIPEGKRVLHLDGNTLNDEPSNLVLGISTDGIFIAQQNHPERQEAIREAMRQGLIAHNKLRGRLKRLTSWNASRWYPVDHTTSTIHNRPVKMYHAVWPAIGFDVPHAPNGGFCDAAALGYPTRKITEAIILAVLADGPLDMPALFARVNTMRAERGEPAFDHASSLYQWTSPLGQDGLISVQRRGRNPAGALYRVTKAGRELRGPWTPVVPVWGAELSGEKYEGYRKVDPELGARRQVSLAESLSMLAAAAAGEAP